MIDADMVVLAAAIEPDKSARRIATMLTASIDTNNFFTEAHAKLRPVESSDGGRIPLRRVPGPEGYSGNGRAGRRGGCEGHRSARARIS